APRRGGAGACDAAAVCGAGRSVETQVVGKIGLKLTRASGARGHYACSEKSQDALPARHASLPRRAFHARTVHRPAVGGDALAPSHYPGWLLPRPPRDREARRGGREGITLLPERRLRSLSGQ